MKNPYKKYIPPFLVGLLSILFLDILSKWLVVQGIMKPTVFIKDFFYLSHFQKNTGIAFSIALPSWLQIGGSFLILFLLMKIGFETIVKQGKSMLLESALLGMVIGGGLGNLMDRIMNGSVVDFIVLGPIPVFNVADTGITVGLLVLFGTMMLNKEK